MLATISIASISTFSDVAIASSNCRLSLGQIVSRMTPNDQVERRAANDVHKQEAAYRRVRSNAGLGRKPTLTRTVANRREIRPFCRAPRAPGTYCLIACLIRSSAVYEPLTVTGELVQHAREAIDDLLGCVLTFRLEC